MGKIKNPEHFELSNPNSAIKTRSVLIADDNAAFRGFLLDALCDEGYELTEYEPEKSSTELLRQPYDVAVVDLMMPGMNGFELCAEVRKYSPNTQFIIITGYPDREKIHQAMEMDIYSFLAKPFRVEQLRYSVIGAIRMKEMFEQNFQYKVMHGSENMGIKGSSEHIGHIRRQILQYAPMDIPVLITGESGTGKDVVANCLHRYSHRGKKPIIALNCAGLTPSLIESELFGHAQGAFTGASKTKRGFFETADGGTIFLDEIGEFPMEMQAKLLRVLDNGEFCRVGETLVRKANVRVISATNQNLDEMIQQKNFRMDLYYRLRGSCINLLPLRDRREDVADLVYHFLGKEKTISPEALAILRKYNWPGNIRELSMVVKNLAAFCVKNTITESAVRNVLGLVEEDTDGKSEIIPYKEARQRMEKEYLGYLMEKTEGNISKASSLSGIDRKNLREKLKIYELYMKK